MMKMLMDSFRFSSFSDRLIPAQRFAVFYGFFIGMAYVCCYIGKLPLCSSAREVDVWILPFFTAVFNCFLVALNPALFCLLEVWIFWSRSTPAGGGWHPVMLFFEAVLPLFTFTVFSILSIAKNAKDPAKADFLGFAVADAARKVAANFLADATIAVVLVLLLFPLKDYIRSAPSKIIAGFNVLRLSTESEKKCPDYEKSWYKIRLAQAYAGIGHFDYAEVILNELIDEELGKEKIWYDRLSDYYWALANIDVHHELSSREWIKFSEYADRRLFEIYQSSRPLDCLKSLEAREHSLGELSCLSQSLIKSYTSHGASDKAIEWKLAEANLARVMLGENSRKFTWRLSETASLYLRLNKRPEATQSFIKALAVEETRWNDRKDTPMIKSPDDLGYDERGKDLTIRDCMLALEKLRAIPASRFPSKGLSESRPNFDFEESYYRQSIATLKQLSCATAVEAELRRLAVLLYGHCLYGKAAECYSELLALKESNAGHQNKNLELDIADLTGAADSYRNVGKFAQAIELYKRVGELKIALDGSEYSGIERDLNRLARLSALEGNVVEAMLLYKKSLARDERRLGSEHPALAIYLNNLGSILVRSEKFEGAENYFRRALKIDRGSSGFNSLDVARDLHNLATLYHRQNRKDEALEMYKQALAIDRAILGEQAFDVKEIEGELQSHLAGLGAAPKANSLNSAKDWLVTDPEFAAN